MTIGVFAAALVVYVFGGAGEAPQEGVEVAAAGQTARTNADGAARLSPPPGTHAVTVGGQPIHDVPVIDGEQTEVLVTFREGRAPEVRLEHRPLPKPDEVAAAADAGPPGRITGTVTSEKDGRPVVGARVFVRGRPEAAVTDGAGRFGLSVPSGARALSVIHPRFSSGAVDVEVVADETREVAVTLAPAAAQLEDLVVTAPYIEGGVAALTAERRDESSVVDVLGAEEMSRAGDSSAASALRRVTGLTLVDGRFVYVRGMGERYSASLLDGASLPSPEPERRVVPLDLFPTGVLSSVVVQKTWSPDMPGGFGGGVVRLRTRRVPDEPFLDAEASTGYRQGTTFEDGLTYEGGAVDFLGIDDGTRALPDGVAKASDGQAVLERTRLSNRGYTAEELEALGESMPNTWDIGERTVPMPLGLSVSGGRPFQLEGGKLGVLGAIHYDQDWQREVYDQTYYDVSDGKLARQHSYRFARLSREVQLGGMAVVGLDLGRAHRLASTTLLLRTTDDETRTYEGYNSDVLTDIRVARLRWVERQLLTEQLRGEHALDVWRGLDLRWHYAYSRADREEPDRRTYRYDNEQGSEVWLISDRPEGNQRLYSDLDDQNHDALLAGRFLLEPRGEDPDAPVSHVEVGAQVVLRQREVQTRRYKFQDKGLEAGDPALRSQGPEQVFSPPNIGNHAFQFQETTRPTDNYSADAATFAGYASVDWLGPGGLRLTGGARLEAAEQVVQTFELFNPDGKPVESKIAETDILPAASATWAFVDSMQLRASFAQTVVRPDFREQSPATFNDVTGGWQVKGNPALDRGLVRHYDLRWEWYLNARDSVSVAGFYKDLDQPIEEVVEPSAQFTLSWANAKGAINVGAEVEARVHLEPIDALKDVFLATNVAWIRSRVELADGGIQTSAERPLQGQSPYVVNGQLGYDAPEAAWRLTVLYNVSGERIVQVGAAEAPDIYEAPRHSLDVTGAVKLGGGFTLKLKAKNLLDPVLRITQGAEVVEARRVGRAFGAALAWTMD